MGRKTYESIGKPLPNRINIIISKTPAIWKAAMCLIVLKQELILQIVKRNRTFYHWWR